MICRTLELFCYIIYVPKTILDSLRPVYFEFFQFTEKINSQ